MPSFDNPELFRALSDPEITSSDLNDRISEEYEIQEQVAVFDSIESSSCESFSFRD